MNRAWYEFTGEPDRSAERFAWIDAVYPNDRKAVLAEGAAARESRKPFTLSYRLRHHTGQYRWVQDTGKPRFQEETFIGFVGAIIDVHERRQAEEAREMQRRHAALLADIARRLVLGEPAHDVLDGVFADLAREVGVEIYFNYNVAPTGDCLHLESARGLSPELRQGFATLRFGQALCGVVAQRRAPLIIEDVTAVCRAMDDPSGDVDVGADRLREEIAYASIPDLATRLEALPALGMEAYASYPLLANGTLIGTLAVASSQPTHFSREHRRFIQAVCDLVAAVMERTRLTTALRVSEERYRRIVETAEEGIWVGDTQGRASFVNGKLAEMLGYRPEEIVGRLYSEFMDMESAAEAQQRLENRRRGLREHYEIRLRRQEGGHLWVWVTSTPVVDAEGRFAGTLAMITDISDRKSVEQEMRLFQRAIQNIAAGVMITDARLPDNPIIFVNSAFERITGYAADEAFGRNPRFLRSSGEREPWQKGHRELQAAMKEGRACRVVVHNRRKDGIPFWNELTVSPVRDEAGQVTHFIGIQNDITERRADEEALQAYATALERSEAHLRAVIEAHPESVMLIAPDGALMEINPAGLAMLEANGPEEALGRSFLEAVAPEFQEAYQRLHERVCRGAKAEMELRITTLRGAERWLETHAVPLLVPLGERGAALVHLAVTRDITRRKRLEQQVVQSEKMAALGELVAGVAHEINNPLAAISGHAQLLAMHPDQQVQEDAQAVRDMTDRASRILRSLRNFARPNPADAPRRAGSLNDVVQAALDVVGYRLRKADVAVRQDLEKGLPLVPMNAGEIEQVVVNLLANAEQAMRQTAVEERYVQITTLPEGDAEGKAVRCMLRIQDNGPGIPAPVLPRIFDPFFTTKDIGEGTGLGLYISYGIVTAHGGRLTAENNPGGGAVFTITLPCQ